MTSRPRRLAAIVLAAVALLLLPGGQAAAGTRTQVTVMTRNLFLGADLAPLAAPTVPALLQAVASIYEHVQATDFPERAKALAGEIDLARPDLVGLQEAVLWRTQSPSDGTATPATTVAYDFLQILLDELAARGLEYRAVAIFVGFDGEVPSASGIDVRLTDRDVILAREGLPVFAPELHRYATSLVLPTPFGGTIVLPRGWASVDAEVAGKRFRFATTHLEPVSEGVQVAQARELLAALGAVSLPVILVGDFNSRADGTGTPAYGEVVGAGYEDAWSRVHPGELGYTCCHDTGLRNPASTFDERIDFVFSRGAFRAVEAGIVGEDPADRTPSGLWPSDHAGVVATLELSAAQTRVIVSDTRIDGYRVKADGSLGGAIAAFGQPSSRRLRRGEACFVRWRALGLRITFYNLGGLNPCTPEGGRFSNAVITGEGWRTAKGLELGAPLSKLRRLYPRATFHRDRGYGPGWWLVTRPGPFGLRGTYPGLLARVNSGRVTALVVRYPAGGD